MARRNLRQRLNTVIYPAPDLEGAWIAHCLELDLISQGRSAAHALDMIAEAVEMLARENAREGKTPLEFRSAPAEVWRMFAGAKEAAVRIIRLPAPVSDDITIVPYLRRAG